ncbi:MAG: HAD hydrolase family protein [Erysipelotrichaceae bacterium]|nr:HAD hydrolase family protein [Erysipelotrichaceae bacterium]
MTMLKFAGIGVAMGNAGEALKKEADYVTEHIDDDGIAKALIHFGLIDDILTKE